MCVCLIVCDLKPWRMEWSRSELGCCARKRNTTHSSWAEQINVYSQWAGFGFDCRRGKYY